MVAWPTLYNEDVAIGIVTNDPVIQDDTDRDIIAAGFDSRDRRIQQKSRPSGFLVRSIVILYDVVPFLAMMDRASINLRIAGASQSDEQRPIGC
jgi:hypothetical protein